MDFKRDVYYKILSELDKTNVIFLLGPRKCGKTYALNQLARDNPEKFVKFNFKLVSDDESMDFYNKVCSDIRVGADVVYLLDEVTYAFFPDTEIAKVANAYEVAEVNGVKQQTKVVFTGSQSVALEMWGRLAFCQQASFIVLDFLTYPEWLRYRGLTEISASTYSDFVTGARSFYKDFGTLEEYLHGCLDETVISNSKSRNYIYGNDCDLVSVEALLNIMYLTMFTLHDNVTAQTLFKDEALADKASYFARNIQAEVPLSKDEIRERILRSCAGCYNKVKSMDIETIKQCYAFLIRCGLVTATPVIDNFDTIIDVLKQLEATNGIYNKKGDLLGKVNVTVNYPMFFMEILKEILGTEIELNTMNELLGSVVECHIRGLLPSYGSFEYRDSSGNEIDYVNKQVGVAIEITISNKHLHSQTRLDMVDDSYYKILLSRDRTGTIANVKEIPFYVFIAIISKMDRFTNLLQQVLDYSDNASYQSGNELSFVQSFSEPNL